jgi:hypothetical protein
MPKKRQIPRLFAQTLADRTIVWHWKPSAKLRKAGFVNVKLGTDQRAAIAAAIDLNDRVTAWDTGAESGGEATPVIRHAPRIVRFAELVSRYRQSIEFTGLRKRTRANYDTRLRQLERWALDGALPVRDIDKPLIRDLRAGLLRGSIFRAAATLRVLRLLLQWAVDEGIVSVNPAVAIDIPDTPARKTRMELAVREAITEAAIALDGEGTAGVADAVELALWMLQRQGDILQLNRMAWREVQQVDPRHAAILADARGRVMAFRLCQQKTGTWIDAPIPPVLHDRIEARFRATKGSWLFAHPDDPDAAMPSWMFQRRFRAARDAAADVAIMRGDMALAEAIDAVQFRDLRRTGMIAYKDAGARTQDITALSGHYVIGHKTILDVYMPGDTAGACACVAAGLQAWRERQERSDVARAT